MSDYELILLSAVRYALGKQSYIVQVTCNYITEQIDTLSTRCLRAIARDIEECNDYGGDWYKRDWYVLFDLIEFYINSKKRVYKVGNMWYNTNIK